MNREESIVFAQKFLEDILSFYGINLAVYSTADEDVIILTLRLILKVKVEIAT